MTEEWPIASPGPAQADRPGDRALQRGGSRLSTVTSDFFLDPVERLTEQERALMTAMLHDLIGSIADDLRVRLPDDLAQACEVEEAELVGNLTRAGLLKSEALIRALLKQATTSGIADGAGGEGIKPLLHQWAADDDSDVAAAAMALILARSRAKDRFGRFSMDLNELARDETERLVHAVAATLAAHCAGPADSALADAAAELVERCGEQPRLEHASRRLAEALKAAGRLNHDLLVTLASRGEAALLAEVLALKAQVRTTDAWELLTGGGSAFALLLRLAGQPRETAASVLVAGEASFALGDPAAAIERFDAVGEEQADAERRRLTRPLAFRQAQEALDDHG